MDINRKRLDDAIVEYNLEVVQEYIEAGWNFEPEERLLHQIIAARNYPAFELLFERVNITDPYSLFYKSIYTYLPIALYVVENSHFETMSDNNEYNNYRPTDMFFPEESLLPPYFEPVSFSNNREAFLAQILNQSLNCCGINEDDFLVTEYLIENRQEVNITDRQILKYLIENSYELKSAEQCKFFTDIIYKMITEEVDFSIDEKGYLVQIAAVNDIPELLVPLMESGCGLNAFWQRYTDKSNWLSEAGEDELEETDYNHERTYNIYKKFDSEHKLSPAMLESFNTIFYHQQMEQSLPVKKDNNRWAKIKM